MAGEDKVSLRKMYLSSNISNAMGALHMREMLSTFGLSGEGTGMLCQRC